MGIFGLESFLLKYLPNACPRVKLEDLIKEYRRETGRTSCVTVIDTNILIRQCLDDLDIVCGGQFAEYKINLLNYIGRLTALGISPVFFLDGSVDRGKMRCWMDRQMERQERLRRIYQSVDEGCNRSIIAAEDTIIPAGMYEATIITIQEAKYPIFCAVSDADVEMAQYARANKCFAIMSRDTDFIILRGARYYVSLFYKHFRASDMSTFLFDREAIAKALGLHPDHLPLLASLLKNDFVDGGYLQPLYSKLMGRRTAALKQDQFYRLDQLIPTLVDFIKRELWSKADHVGAILDSTFNGYPPFLLRNLARELGLRDQFDMKERLKKQLEVSLAMHEYAPRNAPLARPFSPQPEPETDADPEVLEMARVRHRNVSFLNSVVLSLLARRTYEMGPALEDPRLPVACTSETALRPFRRRVYGLLQMPGFFTEVIVPARAPTPDLPVYRCLVVPVSPDPRVHPHPGLLALWREHNEDDADLGGDRWRLFAWALAAHRHRSAPVDALADMLRELPKHLVVPASLVYLLYHSKALEGFDRSAADLVRMLTRTSMVAKLVSETAPGELYVASYDKTVVHVAALFMRSFTYLSVLNDVLGAPVPLDKLHPALYFNGKLFHKIFMNEQPLDPVIRSSIDEGTENLIIKTVCEEVAEVYEYSEE
ncbi:constitutive coactivator of peroxisome proliferator-activated receptor gamma-like [Frankliniella occidentalis]|uniref:Constitutive coactivator of peroxisome proliferator-activated receptor gamma-like n=1 Tax=Frankliniella occidentalis TaxID=133901 RepID=A0A6J1S0I2_FRAOC|nr:constitutive coactivator of peroxisome proliferator-activated receptor gamma-like [Frankliniella occidentalis]